MRTMPPTSFAPAGFGAPLQIYVGGRRWIWKETAFLNGVLPVGVEGGAPDQATLTRNIKAALLATKGRPLHPYSGALGHLTCAHAAGIEPHKQEVVYQLHNDKPTNPQLHESVLETQEVLEPNGIFVSVWMQYLKEVVKREKLKKKKLVDPYDDVDRHYLVTVSIDVGQQDASTIARWGTTEVEPRVNENSLAYKAMSRR